MNTTVKTFVEQFVALVKGDDAKATAAKVQRQAISACKSHIPAWEGDTIALEDNIERAKEQLNRARINFGEEIRDRSKYISNVVKMQNNLIEAEEALEAHLKKIEFIKENLEIISK
jgi:DNA repair exonuclease SbcCD ATPase subunit